MYDLLTNPLITVSLEGSRTELSVPEILYHLTQGHDVGFVNAQQHQLYPALYPVLCHLGALAVVRGFKSSSPPGDAEPREWRAALLSLAPPPAWHLVGEDDDKPAFMQPAMHRSEDYYRKAKPFIRAPDLSLGLIPTKTAGASMHHSKPDHWFYALIALQTLSGYMGRGLYGSSRMNSGTGSRTVFGIGPSHRFVDRWQRDVRALLSERARHCKEYKTDGHALLWLLPWSGKETFSLADLDPYYVDISRRVRLVLDQGKIAAITATSSGPLIHDSNRGAIGDFWTPIERDEAGDKAFTLGEWGWRFNRSAPLLASMASPAVRLRETDGERPWLFAAGVPSIGIGKKAPFQELEIQLPPRIASILRSPEGRKAMLRLIEARVNATVSGSHALHAGQLLLRPNSSAQPKDNRDLRRFWADVDERFFGDLFRDVGVVEPQNDGEWHAWIQVWAWRILQESLQDKPADVEAKATKAFMNVVRQSLLRPGLFCQDCLKPMAPHGSMGTANADGSPVLRGICACGKTASTSGRKKGRPSHGDRSLKEIARDYGKSVATISGWRRNRGWKDGDPPPPRKKR